MCWEFLHKEEMFLIKIEDFSLLSLCFLVSLVAFLPSFWPFLFPPVIVPSFPFLFFVNINHLFFMLVTVLDTVAVTRANKKINSLLLNDLII